jgi:hypothetical protein
MTIHEIGRWVSELTDRSLLCAWDKYCAPSESAEKISETDITIAYIVQNEIHNRGL